MTSTSLAPQPAGLRQASVSRFSAEYRTDTAFVANPRPRLSWVVATESTDWQQTRAELRLTRAGAVESAVHEGPDSVLVEWPFGAIDAGEQVAVEVRVSGNDGGTTAWSAPLALAVGYLEGPWQAEAIGLPVLSRAEIPLGQPGQLRHEFTVGPGLAKATLFATAHGVYQAEINGSEVDDQVLKPGWTAYADRLNHETTDVTALLKTGANAIGVWLAGGWYTEKYGFHGFATPFYGEQPAVKVELHLEYANGTRQTVASGPEWRGTTAGPLVSSGIYAGESFDARRIEAGWSSPDFDDSRWLPACLDSGAVNSRAADSKSWVEATPAVAPPVRRIEELPVREILTTPSGATVLDFGQNLVGRLRIRVSGDAGRRITLRHAEVLEDGELSLRPLRLAAATDSYTLAGGGEDSGEEEWEPRFTFHGFRYAQVDNWPGELDPAAITAVVIHNDMRRTGWFECSDPMLNRLHENALWGMRGNFLALPTDCPQRDERLGWTGDIQVFSPTASYLYDSLGFLSSWLQDLALEQSHRNGVVPIVVPAVLGMLESPVAAWGDAATVVPWVLYERFGDLGLLGRQYRSMCDWADALLRVRDSSGLWQGQMQLGDWLDPAAPPDKPGAARTHGDIVASAYLFRSLDLTAKAAAVLGADDHGKYSALAEDVRSAFLAEYVTPAGRMVSDAQTAYSLALMFGISTDPVQRQALGDRLAELVRLGGYRIATGFVGTPLIADALTVTGHMDAAERLLTQTECPSWLYPVTQGATTIWERWDSILEDGTVNPGEMTSFNHYALGAIADWMHRTVAGLAPAAPGYRKQHIAPRPLRSLQHAGTSHETPYGLASVAWKRSGERILVEAVVPSGTTAVVSLPDGSEEFEVGSGRYAWDVRDAAPAAAYGAVSLDSPLSAIMDDPGAYAAVWQAIDAHDPAAAAQFRKDTVWYRQTSLNQGLIFTPAPIKREIGSALSALSGTRTDVPPLAPREH
ncbi:alpha-L-rhamnosidase [Arthrobacter bambusae]|uniref:alpha-L-rhamnosidase n=1 Tax=Arthrobacter bambusae TaxID=1338426 RepID=UPI0027829862|nr:alpha-L-rhamnosidase [Arthrobacter bambusae]MDQ0238865.1 alpha-L-rhamnosidase [Arthrobacter bambusae]